MLNRENFKNISAGMRQSAQGIDLYRGIAAIGLDRPVLGIVVPCGVIVVIVEPPDMPHAVLGRLVIQVKIRPAGGESVEMPENSPHVTGLHDGFLIEFSGII